MKAMQLTTPQAIENNPLCLVDVPVPGLRENDVMIRVHACGVCHTDLHVVEGDLLRRYR